MEDYFSDGLRHPSASQYDLSHKDALVVDSKAELLRLLQQHVAARRGSTLPPEWEWLAPSLQKWWLQEQRVSYLTDRLNQCKHGIAMYDFRMGRIHQLIDSYNVWFDARYELEYYGGPPPPEAYQEYTQYKLDRAYEMEVETANLKKRKRQAQLLRLLLEEEEQKLCKLQAKITKADMEQRREDNMARRK